jgi:hypothetical protein
VVAVRAVITGGEALGNDLVEELGRVKEGNPVECPAQDIVVEVLGGHAVTEVPVDSGVREKSQIQVETPVDGFEILPTLSWQNVIGSR